MQEEGTSQRSVTQIKEAVIIKATCTVLKPFQEDLMLQLENEYAPDTSQPEEPPDVSVLDNVVFNMSSEKVDRTLSQMENSADQRSFNIAAQRLLVGVQESGNNEIPSSIKDGQFLSATKILTDESSEKDSGDTMEPSGNNLILNVTTEQTTEKTFGTSSFAQLGNQCTEGEEDVFSAVTFVSQTSKRSTEEQEFVTTSQEKSKSDCILNPSHQMGIFATNDDATYKNFTHDQTGSLVQNDMRVENSGTTQTSQMPYKENFIPLNSFFTSYLQEPSLFFARKMKSVPPKVSFVPPSPETNPSESLQAQAQQDMLVPSEQSQFYGFSPDYPKVIIGDQKCGVVHSSTAQTGSGNLLIPQHNQSLYSGTGKSSVPTSWSKTLSANNSPRLPPDKRQCSESTRKSLKMKLKKKTTSERHQPYKDQRPNNGLVPRLKEFETPFKPFKGNINLSNLQS